MPRPWIETVHDWPQFLAAVWYLARVVTVDKARDPPAIQVTLELLDHGQEGRRIDIALPLPIHLAGVTAGFLRACVLEVSADSRVRPKDAVGKNILARFDPATNQPTGFKEHFDEQQSKSSSDTRRPPILITAAAPSPNGDRRRGG